MNIFRVTLVFGFFAVPTLTIAQCTFSGHFSNQVGDSPRCVATGDLDGNGYIDLATANTVSDDVSVLLNNGDGTFAQQVRYHVGDGPWSVASCDLDDDGDLDLVVPIAGEFNLDPGTQVSVLFNNGDGIFAAPVSIATGGLAPFWLVADDLDNDGDCDIAVTNFDSNDVSILLNNGDGTFSSPIIYTTGFGPAYIASGDLDGDNDLDLVVANFSSGDISLFMNNGDGTFMTKKGFGGLNGALTVAIGDWDDDDDLDLVVNSYMTGPDVIVVFLNDGNGQFFREDQYMLGNNVISVTTGDLDGDDDLDLVVANQDDDTVSVLDNHKGTFTEIQTVLVGDGPRFVSLADLDNDKYLDLAVANRLGDQVSVLWNECGGGVFEVAADSFTVTRGQYVSGGIPELADSDNLDLSLRRLNSDIQSRTEFEVKAVSPTASPNSLGVTLEGAVFARSEVTQTIELFDYALGAWEQVDSRVAMRFSDSVATIAATGDLSGFVEAGTRCMKARIRYQSTNPRQQFSSNTDQFIWTIE